MASDKHCCSCCALVGGRAKKVWAIRCYLPTSGGTRLHAAVARNDVEEAARMLEEHTSLVDAPDEFNSTPLHLACKACLPEAVALLLRAGADTSRLNCLGFAPLHSCCCQPYDCPSKAGAALEIVQLLLDAGADLKAAVLPGDGGDLGEVLGGETAITLLAQHALPGTAGGPLVACLLAAGADPLQPALGLEASALELACAAGDADVVQLLLAAAPTSKYYDQAHAFDPGFLLRSAVAHDSVDVAALLLDPVPSLQAVLQHAVSPDPSSVLSDEGSSLSASEASFQVAHTENPDIYTPAVLEACLHDAIRLGSLPLVRLLLQAGASASCNTTTPRIFRLYQDHIASSCSSGRFPMLSQLDSLRDYFDAPLQLAICEDHENIAAYLIKRATPHPMFDRSSRTALHWATIQGRLRIMLLLLESRAYYQEWEGERLINKPHLEGWTPLAIAVHYKNVQAVELLLHFKASTCTPIYTSSGRYMAPVNEAMHLIANEDSAGSGILTALLESGARVDPAALQMAAALPDDSKTLLMLQSFQALDIKG